MEETNGQSYCGFCGKIIEKNQRQARIGNLNFHNRFPGSCYDRQISENRQKGEYPWAEIPPISGDPMKCIFGL